MGDGPFIPSIFRRKELIKIYEIMNKVCFYGQIEYGLEINQKQSLIEVIEYFGGVMKLFPLKPI